MTDEERSATLERRLGKLADLVMSQAVELAAAERLAAAAAFTACTGHADPMLAFDGLRARLVDAAQSPDATGFAKQAHQAMEKLAAKVEQAVTTHVDAIRRD